MFPYKDLHAFTFQHFPFHQSVYQHIAVVFPAKKKGAGLSHKHSAVVDWINTARLIFPLIEHPLHIRVFPFLSHGVKCAGSPFVLLHKDILFMFYY